MIKTFIIDIRYPVFRAHISYLHIRYLHIRYPHIHYPYIRYLYSVVFQISIEDATLALYSSDVPDGLVRLSLSPEFQGVFQCPDRHDRHDDPLCPISGEHHHEAERLPRDQRTFHRHARHQVEGRLGSSDDDEVGCLTKPPEIITKM